jgi:hypothetical protein
MATSFKARDGTKISDGDTGTFELAHGYYAEVHERVSQSNREDYPVPVKAGDPVIVRVTGTIHRFDHVERVYDEEHIAVGKTTEERWEIVTDDPNYPAVGITPENVLARLS